MASANKLYRFRHTDGEVSEVRVPVSGSFKDDEATARDAAMRLRWGPPRDMYGDRYAGFGLQRVFGS